MAKINEVNAILETKLHNIQVAMKDIDPDNPLNDTTIQSGKASIEGITKLNDTTLKNSIIALNKAKEDYENKQCGELVEMVKNGIVKEVLTVMNTKDDNLIKHFNSQIDNIPHGNKISMEFIRMKIYIASCIISAICGYFLALQNFSDILPKEEVKQNIR